MMETSWRGQVTLKGMVQIPGPRSAASDLDREPEPPWSCTIAGPWSCLSGVNRWLEFSLSCSRHPHGLPWKPQQAFPGNCQGNQLPWTPRAPGQRQREVSTPSGHTHLRADVCCRWRQEPPHHESRDHQARNNPEGSPHPGSWSKQ